MEVEVYDCDMRLSIFSQWRAYAEGTVSRKFEYASLNNTLTDSMMEQLIKFKTAQKSLQSIHAPLLLEDFTPTMNHLNSLSEGDYDELEIVKDESPFVVEATQLKPDKKGRKRTQRLQLARTLYYGIEN
jgi:hypothetical protein